MTAEQKILMILMRLFQPDAGHEIDDQGTIVEVSNCQLEGDDITLEVDGEEVAISVEEI